jgi:hypothetical protein
MQVPEKCCMQSTAHSCDQTAAHLLRTHPPQYCKEEQVRLATNRQQLDIKQQF